VAKAKETTDMRTMHTIKIGLATALAVAVAGPMLTPSAYAQPLRRDLASYFILAQRKATLKDMQLDSACNIGVNCGIPGNLATCGQLSYGATTQADGSQTVGHATFFRKPGAKVWQVFRNNDSSLANVSIGAPPPSPFDTPIIPGTCSGCVPDVAALQAACGFADPFPACDPTNSVKVAPNGDCSAGDTNPGNGACDLPPGTYGLINVLNGARLNMSPGVYNVCDFKSGKGVIIDGTGVQINVNGGFFKLNNNNDLGDGCGDFTVHVKGSGQVSFGRNSLIAAKVCAPQSNVKLGHNNTLIGQFIGDVVNADLNDRGQCCGGRCSCYDGFTPTTASVGATITATGTCDMSATTKVTVCGFEAPITVKTPLELKFTVPAGASGACDVVFESPAGSFLGFSKLTVN
jgi:hypothetical protein